MKPGRTFFVSLLLLLFLGAASFFYDTLYLVWFYASALLLFFVIIDALFLLLFTDRLQIERELSGVLTLGKKALVRLRISRTKTKSRHGYSRPLARSIEVFDIYPDTMECNAFPAKPDRRLLKKNSAIVFEYHVVPFDRGVWEWNRTELLLGSPLGFWRLKTIHHCKNSGKTFPDFRKLASSTDLRGVLERSGVKASRKRGQGLEFMSLREYQKGDSVRAIDWRATGRRRKTIVREYKEEQDQQVLLLLDSGYRLHRLEETSEAGEYRTQFDSALEAALMLSWIALKHDDGVALNCFGAQERWLPPRKGMGRLTAIIHSLYDVKSAPSPSSLFSALESALSKLKRRTFIILISNLREEDGESLSWILKRIRRQHLLLLVSLRETEAEQIASRKPEGKEQALETAAAFAYLSARRRLYKTWEHLGLLTLECSHRELSSALIRQYLEVKRGGLL